MSGVILETEERDGNATGLTPKMDVLIWKLIWATKDPSVKSWLPKHVVRMLTSLVELREDNWGQQDPADAEESNTPEEVRSPGANCVTFLVKLLTLISIFIDWSDALIHRGLKNSY
jgi:hypothetical protein